MSFHDIVTNAAFDVELPDDAPVSELLTELVKEIGLPRTDEGGELIAYELSSKRTGDWVRDGTLGSKGVKSGDVLLLTSTFVAGVLDKVYYENKDGMTVDDVKTALRDFDDDVRIRLPAGRLVAIQADPNDNHGIIFVVGKGK